MKKKLTLLILSFFVFTCAIVAQTHYYAHSNMDFSGGDWYSAASGGTLVPVPAFDNTSVFHTNGFTVTVTDGLLTYGSPNYPIIVDGGILDVRGQDIWFDVSGTITCTGSGKIRSNSTTQFYFFKTDELGTLAFETGNETIGAINIVDVANLNFVGNMNVNSLVIVEATSTLTYTSTSVSGTLTIGGFDGVGAVTYITDAENFLSITINDEVSAGGYVNMPNFMNHAGSSSFFDCYNFTLNKTGVYSMPSNIVYFQNNLTIGSNAILNIGANSFVGTTSAITNNGEINIEPYGYLISDGSLQNNGTINALSNADLSPTGCVFGSTYSGSGTYNIERWIPANKWHFIGSPLANSFPVQDVFLNDYVYTYNEAGNSQAEAWVSLVFGENINPEMGYLVQTLQSGGKTFQFSSSTLATTPLQIDAVNSDASLTHGFNLIANPFLRNIHWNNANLVKNQLANVYFIWNSATGNYAVWDGVGSNGTNGATGYIPGMQGFIVKVAQGYSTGSLTITDECFLMDNTPFLKGDEIKNSELIRLQVAGNNNFKDETIIQNSTAVSEAAKLFTFALNSPSLWVVGEDNNYAIFNTDATQAQEISVGFKNSENGTFTISASEFTLSNTNVTLSDLVTGTTVNLAENSSYTFNYNINDAQNRFVIHTSPFTTDVENIENQINVFATDGAINIHNFENSEATISVVDVLGRNIYNHTATENNHKIEIEKTGIYFVKVTTEKGTFVKSVFVNN